MPELVGGGRLHHLGFLGLMVLDCKRLARKIKLDLPPEQSRILSTHVTNSPHKKLLKTDGINVGPRGIFHEGISC